MRMLTHTAVAATIAFAAAALAPAAPATAQTYGGVTLSFGSNGHRWYPRYNDYYDDTDGVTQSVCSGERAEQLENRLRHEVDEDEIDDDDADRIHNAIDRLEVKQRHECDEGDRRAIRDIAYRYDRIGQWIEREAHQGW